MKAYVYILKNTGKTFYIGSTVNLERRLRAHKSGNTQTTKNMKNVELVLAQEYESLMIARKIERKLKNMKRKDYLEKIVDDGYIRMQV
ncbi:MAG TPA: GIY-YIG nuclease family protein [Candidatus Paceibacterota bacterium]